MKTTKSTKTEGNSAVFANPFIDAQFKLIFDKSNTMMFLNSLLELESPIVDIQFENTESIDTSIYGRTCYFDVLCRDQNGKGMELRDTDRLYDMSAQWSGQRT